MWNNHNVHHDHNIYSLIYSFERVDWQTDKGRCQQHNYGDITCSINVSSPTSEALELLGSGLGGEAAEKYLFLCLSQTFSDRQKSKTGVSTGSAFPLWSKVRDKKGLKTHVEVATFLHNLPTLASGRFTPLLLACDNIRKRIAVRQTGRTAPELLPKLLTLLTLLQRYLGERFHFWRHVVSCVNQLDGTVRRGWARHQLTGRQKWRPLHL